MKPKVLVTREVFDEVLDYLAYEKKLDALFGAAERDAGV